MSLTCVGFIPLTVLAGPERKLPIEPLQAHKLNVMPTKKFQQVACRTPRDLLAKQYHSHLQTSSIAGKAVVNKSSDLRLQACQWPSTYTKFQALELEASCGAAIMIPGLMIVYCRSEASPAAMKKQYIATRQV